MKPYLADADCTLYHGDVLDVLRQLPDASVDCCVTSPPYWGLRSYLADGHDDKPLELGLEKTPEEYVTRMVEVFREVRRVLAPHGTVWLNLGDSYAGSNMGYRSNAVQANSPKQRTNPGANLVSGRVSERDVLPSTRQGGRGVPLALSPRSETRKPKDLVGIPWRVAFALQADGWYLRSDIIWAKPNPMPESVTDRPTKAHEYVFLLSKAPRYYFDQEAVREAYHPDGRQKTWISGASQNGERAHENYANREGNDRWPGTGRNVRSVWSIATQPYPNAHFATFPEELARRCIAAGCPEQVCRACGKARERILETWHQPVKYPGGVETPVGEPVRSHKNEPHAQAIGGPQSWEHGRARRIDKTIGFTDCGCLSERDSDVGRSASHQSSLSRSEKYRPGIVLDPFIGSGTVAYVARKLGRHSIGIDLNESYLALAAKRLQQQSLLTEIPA